MNESEANQNMSKKCPQCGASLPAGALDGLCPACLLAQGVADTGPEAAPFQPPGVEELARLFPQLEILAFIGKGGMGAVYKARQPALDRVVALKILPPQAANGPGFPERFSREARALAKLAHPNIVAVHEFGQVNGLPFFIMEFVDGLNLRQLERAGKLSPREALQIVPQICEALQFAHDEGIVHRDIKPENILLDKKGRVKIADFGIAKIMGLEPDVDLTQTKDAIGTPHYMAPEQLEKPTTVDHRADIFSLGVVFYEMLTGELPLGKFAPPSSRKVEVDVRLDDVVLRALEKDPERRYQHVSQVKTAVDTIASTAASPPPPSANAAAMAQEILAQDYNLDIGSCVRRGWALLRGDFWPLVGITALLIALLGFAIPVGGASLRHGPAGADSAEITSVLGILVWGPLMGGLYLYFLKKIRREKTTVETAFSGFSNRFLHLFLAGFVTGLLTWLGFLLILPGIYLLVAWMFTLPLVMDKQLDFWSAMELSRKVVTKHWWKFLGFGIVLLLLTFAGVLACVIGVFVMSPLVLAALMYAYEDIFGGAARTATPLPVGAGPSGTAVLPGTPPKLPRSEGGTWTPATKIGLAAVVVVIGLVVVISLFHSARRHRQRAWQDQQVAAEPAEPAPPAEPVESATRIPNLVFGPVIERVIDFTNSNRRALILVSGNYATPAPGRAFDFGAVGGETLRAAGVDLYFRDRLPDDPDGRVSTLDWRMLCDAPSGNPNFKFDTVESVSPQVMQGQLDFWNNEGWKTNGVDPGLAGLLSGVKTRNLRKHEEEIYVTNVQLFITREGTAGVLQILESDNPAGVTIRYKLVEPTPILENDRDTAAPAGEKKFSRETLTGRLEAASMMNNFTEKDKSLAVLAIDAAKAGEMEIVKKSLGQMTDFQKRDEIAHESARALAKRGLRKQALEIAKSINDFTVHDQALSELAQ